MPRSTTRRTPVLPLGDRLHLTKHVREAQERRAITRRQRPVTRTAFLAALEDDFPGQLAEMRRRLEARSARLTAGTEYAWLVGTSGVLVDPAEGEGSRPRLVLDPGLPYGYCQLLVVELDVPDGGRDAARRRIVELGGELDRAIRGAPPPESGEVLRQPER